MGVFTVKFGKLGGCSYIKLALVSTTEIQYSLVMHAEVTSVYVKRTAERESVCVYVSRESI